MVLLATNAAAVYFPLTDELFSATIRGGAYLNGSRIRTSGCASLSAACVATDTGYDRTEQGVAQQMQNMQKVLVAGKTQALRISGTMPRAATIGTHKSLVLLQEAAAPTYVCLLVAGWMHILRVATALTAQNLGTWQQAHSFCKRLEDGSVASTDPNLTFSVDEQLQQPQRNSVTNCSS